MSPEKEKGAVSRTDRLGSSRAFSPAQRSSLHEKRKGKEKTGAAPKAYSLYQVSYRLFVQGRHN